jgi:hypothetical protein
VPRPVDHVAQPLYVGALSILCLIDPFVKRLGSPQVEQGWGRTTIYPERIVA